MTRSASRRVDPLKALLRLAAVALLLAAVDGGARETLLPTIGDADSTPIGRNGTIYYHLGTQKLIVPVQGPGTLSGYARMALSGPGVPARPGRMKVAGFPGGPAQLEMEFKPSSKAAWNDGREGVPSGGRKFEVEIPAGKHELVITSEDKLWVVFYWDGPTQPVKKKEESPWDLRPSVGLRMIYNDNILTASDDDIEDFELALHPDYYIHKTTDDLVLAPMIQLEARRDLLPWGQTRIRGRVRSWLYSHNSVKNNHDFDFYLRQYFARGTSLELYLHAAPEQYIRQLTDRTPLEDPGNPIERKEFRFQRNIWHLNWRQRISNAVDGSLIFERNYRYYNRPFMENDIEAWELRGSLSWDITDRVGVIADYSFEDGNGRGIDMEGETIETSNDSDPSYERDLYRFEIQVAPPTLDRWLDRIDFVVLYMDYYYTTDRLLVEDPYHVGRRDEFTKFTLGTRRRISRPLTVQAAVRRTERITSSPWEGDLTTDKAFVQWQYWIDLTYRF